MVVPVRWSTSRTLRAVLVIALLLSAAISFAVPTRASVGAQEADPPVSAQQIGARTYVPIVQDVRGGQPKATAWLRLSSPRINPGSYFALTVLTKSTGTAPEPFVNVFVTYNTGIVDFQSANTVPGDFVRTLTDGLAVQFNGPLQPGQERYATIVMKARTGITNVDVRFAGSYEAAGNASFDLPKVTLPIGGGQIQPTVRYACEFGRGGSGPLGQNPDGNNRPFGTPYTFGAFRRDNGGCGFTFSPNARVLFWVAQPTGPSVPTNIVRTADTYGEVEIRYDTRQLLSACPVNLCAFAMNGSSDNSYVLVAPFNLTRPALAGAATPAAASKAGAADQAPINAAQAGRGGLQGTVTGVNGALLEGVTVAVIDQATGAAIAFGTTDAAGQYRITSGIPSGSYLVEFDTAFSGVENTERHAAAELPVTIAEPFTAVLNASLQPGGRISGRVTAEGGATLREVLVWVYDATQTEVVDVTSTDANGNYTSAALPSGNYVVQFDPASSGNDASTGYAGEYHNEQPLSTPPVPATVTAPATTSNVNGTLARVATLGAIEGRVTGAGGAALSDVTVVVRTTSNGQQVAVETTDEDGRYHVGLPSGTYSVEFFTDVSPLAQIRQYLDSFATPTSIQVTAPAVVGGINGVLAVGGQVGGRVTAEDGGAGLPDVVVAVYAGEVLVTTTITDADGDFITPALTNGSYSLQFETADSPTETTRAYAPATRTVSITGPGIRSVGNVTLSK